VRVARDAGVKNFVLFHHDPSHDDSFVTALEADCQKHFPEALAAREGMVLDVGAGEVRLPRGAVPKKNPARKPARKPAKKAARKSRPVPKKKSPKK
jgi:hypothetical protein